MHEISFRVPEGHLTETVKGEELRHGSTYHDSLAEFTGLVTRSHDDGSHDIVIFPPDKPPAHVAGVREGNGPGTLSFTGDKHRPDKKRAHTGARE